MTDQIRPTPLQRALTIVGELGRGGQKASEGQTVLQARIRARLDELRVTPRKVSLAAGLGPDAIRTILSGRSRSPRAENLQALALALHCDVGYLLGTQDEPLADHAPHRLPNQSLVGVIKMHMRERLRIGWVDIGRISEEKWQETDISTLPQYLPGYQYLALLDDTSFNRIYPKGALLHVLDMIGSDAPIRDGDVVIVHRQRLQDEGSGLGSLERSVRLARQLAPGEIVLETASTDPAVQDAVPYEGKSIEIRAGNLRISAATGEAVELGGIVLRAYIHTSGPRILGREVSQEDGMDVDLP